MDSSHTKIKSRRTVNGKALLLCIVFLFFSQMMSSAQITASLFTPSTTDQRTTVSVDFEKVPLAEALQTLARKVNVGISYKTVAVPPKRVTYRAENTSIFKILDDILKDTGLQSTLSQDRKVIMIKKRPALKAVQQSTITGKVTDAGTGQTLPGVNIAVKGTTTGTSTDADGQYELTVESLQDTLVFSYVGYQTKEVLINGKNKINVALRSSMLGLDEVVVTGTGGNATKREVGNTISTISMQDVPEVQTSVDNLLGGRISGASISKGSGQSGAAGQIRLRGSSSISMSNYPLVYVDGIRLARGGYPKTVPPVGFQGRGNNSTPSPLNDISPTEIERVEVIKGAAAATLYGTQAAAGVIQIFTKQGTASDKPSWTLQVDQGFDKEQKFGTEEFPYMRIKPWLRKGYNQKYHLSVGGGNDDLTYFVSGTYGNADGVLPDDSDKKMNVRGNFNLNILKNLSIKWNSAYTRNGISNPPSGNNAQGLTINAFRGPGNYFGDGSYDVVSQTLDFRINNTINHLITGGTVNFDPADYWSNKLTIGYDRASLEARQYRPFGFAQLPGGAMTTKDWSNETITLDYTGNLNFNVSSDFTAKTSLGGQTVQTTNHVVTGYAKNFAAPGEPTLSSGGSSLSFEDRIREINYGVFGQEVLGYKERYYLTFGLRYDGNSAFGKNLGMRAYPKVSATYVISEEPFWNSSWGQLKLRAAYGQAGQAPGVFDAVRTWSPEAFRGKPAFTPNTLGNEELGPERTIETSGGFDAHLINQRLNINFTYYHQLTKDALLPVPQIPSQGFLEPQLQNAGRLKNEGMEFSIDATILQSTNFSWNMGLNLSTNHSEVLSLGDSPPFEIGKNLASAWIEEGHSVPAIRGRKVLNEDKHAEPEFYKDGDFYIYGPNNPTRTIGLNLGFGFPKGIYFSARGQYKGGHFIQDGASSASESPQYWPVTKPWYQKIQQGNRDQLTALQRARTDQKYRAGDYSLWTYPADNIRLSSLTLQIPITSFFKTKSLNNAIVSFTASNIRLWTKDKFLVFDPEMNGNEGANTSSRSITEHVPAPMTFTASLKVSF